MVSIMFPITYILCNNQITVISMTIISHTYHFFVAASFNIFSPNYLEIVGTLLFTLPTPICNRNPEIILQAKCGLLPVEKSFSIVSFFRSFSVVPKRNLYYIKQETNFILLSFFHLLFPITNLPGIATSILKCLLIMLLYYYYTENNDILTMLILLKSFFPNHINTV